MLKFTAPADTTSVHLSAGPRKVVGGVLSVPADDLTDGDRIGLAANGFVPFVEEPKAPTKTDDKKA